MQQAIYTNAHIAKHSVNPGHGTGIEAADVVESKLTEDVPRQKRFRLLLSVAGNVLGGTVLLSGMLMLPELIVSLLGR